MRLPGLLSLPLLMSRCVAPGVAQSPQTIAPPPLPNVFATQPLPGSRIPPMDFHAQPPNANDASTHKLSPRTLKLLNPFVFHPNDLYALETPYVSVRLGAGIQVAHNERCYAIRDYNFSRVAPQSDATKLSGTSTCEPAAQVRLKGTLVR
jgi:hypothetical protein